jgi:hypothetical protein
MSLHSHQWIPKAEPSFVVDLQGHPKKTLSNIKYIHLLLFYKS